MVEGSGISCGFGSGFSHSEARWDWDDITVIPTRTQAMITTTANTNKNTLCSMFVPFLPAAMRRISPYILQGEDLVYTDMPMSKVLFTWVPQGLEGNFLSKRRA